ncbi:hypothetical protein V2K41_04450 [Pseudomonas alliivorans]|nr:hypothetical protein [Pseudomonas alliivorans]MEE4913518.1 hypothetical protein [Pseudomonas alliivorans]
MKGIYVSEMYLIAQLESPIERFTHLTSTLRSMLQVCAITSLELIRQSNKTYEHFSGLENLTSRLQHPSDGLPVEILEKTVPIIRSLINVDFLHGWFEEVDVFPPLIKKVVQWVEFRNSTAHGVPDQNDIAEWEPKLNALINQSLNVFEAGLPSYNVDDDKLKLRLSSEDISIDLPLALESKAQVLKKVVFRKGVWKMQTEKLCWSNSTEINTALATDNMFSEQTVGQNDRFSYSTVYSKNKTHGILHNIPARQTTNFEGRKKEIARLTEWINEPAESKSCLIYGDGGYGKTTLALEFLNRILDGSLGLSGTPPEIISYHTAKMTRWTDQGITHFRGISGAMGESLRELMYCFHDILGKEWYTLDDFGLLNKVQTVLVEQGYKRDDILLILDNTETLTSSTSDTEELTQFLEQVEKKIGRVILTSRRREGMGSRLIKVSELEERESVLLMTRLAKEYGAKPILQSGEAKLRKASAQLMHKPLLIDALVKYISRTSVGVDDALNSVLRKTNDQLLEFLYEDAWLRMSEGQRDVFLVIVLMTCPIDEFSVGYACQEVGIPHDEFLLGLEETYFANQTKIGSKYEIEIVELAREFFFQKFSKLMPDERRAEVRAYAESVDSFAKEKEAVEREYRSDRVAEAFRGQFAKAAKIAAEKGRITDAEEHYTLAVQEDPLNSALHDRFAWFLLHMAHKIEPAFDMAKKAVELDQRNADALLTLGIIHYRKHQLEEGDKIINAANKEGKPASLCLLRMGIGRYHTAKSISDIGKSAILIEQGIEFLRRALREIKPTEKYFNRNTTEIYRHLRLLQSLMYNLQSKAIQRNSVG